MKMQKILTSGLAGLTLAMVAVAPVAAATIVVTPSNEQGWSTVDTRPGGDVEIVVDATAPGGEALQLTTADTATAKAQYLHDTATPIADVTELSYMTRQVSSPFAGAAASYQLPVLLNGNAGGFTTLVYEPYQNGVVVPNDWQTWDVDAGQFWSSRTVTCSNGGVLAGGGGAPFYTLEDIATMCPEAIAIQFGVNIGSNNPDWVVESDLVNFNGTVYNFELVNEPTAKDECKNSGFASLTDAEGSFFGNQGQCVSYFNHLD